MFRLLMFLAALALAAWGLMWLSDNPGVVTVAWRGVEYQVSLLLALGAVALLAVAVSMVWGVLRFVFNIPSFVTLARRARKREKGLLALSRGMIAVGAGDARAAARHAADAGRLLQHEPMTKLLRAQAAQLAGDRESAVAAYNAMLEHHETHGLGLRGLHVEARRGGDHEAALQYATRANAHAPAAWAGQAVLDDRARRGDWAGALATVDSNASARLIDRPTANRWRAVIKTAMAEEIMERDPKGALDLAQQAFRLAPALVPAATICGRLTAGVGDYRRASKILESAYAQTPHPDLAAAYLMVRHGNSTADQLARARTLARTAPNDPESLLTVGRAALEAHEREVARAAVAPLIASDSPHGRPTRRVCLLMADIETRRAISARCANGSPEPPARLATRPGWPRASSAIVGRRSRRRGRSTPSSGAHPTSDWRLMSSRRGSSRNPLRSRLRSSRPRRRELSRKRSQRRSSRCAASLRRPLRRRVPA